MCNQKLKICYPKFPAYFPKVVYSLLYQYLNFYLIPFLNFNLLESSRFTLLNKFNFFKTELIFRDSISPYSINLKLIFIKV